MSKLNIIFRKEVTVDLNSYYPNFPPALRKQIDDALFKLLGGSESRKGKVNGRENVSSAGVNDAVILRRLPHHTMRTASATAALLADYKPGTEVLREDLLKAAVSLYKMDASSVIHNLIRRGYFEVVK